MGFLRTALVFGLVGMALGAFVAVVWLQDKSIVRAAQCSDRNPVFCGARVETFAP